MAIDPTLVKSVARAYEYQNFVPEIDNLGLADFGQKIAKGRQMKRIKDENIQKEVKSYIDKYPPDIPLEKIPEKYRSAISEFSFKQKKIYSDAVASRVNMKAGTDEYQEQTDLMNGSLQSIANLKSQWDTFGQGKKENLGDISSGNYSLANNSDNLGLIASVYTDKLDASISDSGDLSFLTGDGGSFSLNDIDQPFLKASEEAMYIEQELVKAHDDGVMLSEASVNLKMSQIRKVIEKGGIDSIKSLALDNLVANVELYDGSEEIFERIDSDDPAVSLEARTQLENDLLSKYRTSLISQSQTGYNAKNPVKAKPPTSMDVLKSKSKMFETLFVDVKDESKAPIAKANLQKNLNMQVLRYTDYYVDYDKETDQFFLYDKNEKQDFQDEGAIYPATGAGVIRMLEEIDSSRL